LQPRSDIQTAMAPKIKLTYFNIEAAAEKVRLALVMTGTEFEDNRLSFEEWQPLKPSTPYGQLPIMEITGEDGTTQTVAQSDAMMRWVCRKFDATNTLLPTDPDELMKVEEVIGLFGDFSRAWQPNLYIGMRHMMYGYPEEWPEKAAKVQEMRTNFLATEMPKYMEFFKAKLEKTGAFLCGDKPTMADLMCLAQMRYFTKGVADHVPGDCLAPYPVITAWMDRMHAVPQIKAWYKL